MASTQGAAAASGKLPPGAAAASPRLPGRAVAEAAQRAGAQMRGPCAPGAEERAGRSGGELEGLKWNRRLRMLDACIRTPTQS